MALSEQLVSDIVSSPDRVSSALNIIAAADALRERLITRLREEIAVLAAARGWTLLPEKRSVIQWSGFSIRYGANDELKFRLEFGDERRAQSYFGIWGIGPGHADYLPAAALLTEAFGRGRQSQVWPWHRIPDKQDPLFPMEGDWSASDVPWRAIADGSLAPRFIAAAQMFYDALAPTGFVGRH